MSAPLGTPELKAPLTEVHKLVTCARNIEQYSSPCSHAHCRLIDCSYVSHFLSYFSLAEWGVENLIHLHLCVLCTA